MTIDGYCHCGKTKYRPLQDVVSTLDAVGVGRAVLVQHMGEYDNSYIGKALAENPSRFAGVALLNPTGDWSAALKTLAASAGWKGVRVDQPMLLGATAMCRAVLERGLELLVYIDEDGVSGVQEQIADLATSNPKRRIVISHYGIADRVESFNGFGLACGLSSISNVRIVLSGLSQFSKEPFDPFIEPTHELIECFGTERLMWGSNFPVCGDRGGYAAALDFIQSGKLGLSDKALNDILSKTADETWFA
ncbi:amidohydrolase [Mesorhizobium sp. CA8]|uniref:amidohydrolase family protein n=1 Tax=unclassified Mesorhizobium TaxID=325217 RepID=UPI001CCDEA8C|nr:MULTISPECIES: amidohydrolase family protein [unclassified Mesorhizobium]MBZ9761703.1 amidohydrolase [Mesorhizobium sp. CA8]MBZ9820543.1 amidohydrolase [Mesorhizobium sp. CA4]